MTFVSVQLKGQVARLSLSIKSDSSNFIVVLFQEIATATPAFNSHHTDQPAANIEARLTISKRITTH
jgi:hypothetical protein